MAVQISTSHRSLRTDSMQLPGNILLSCSIVAALLTLGLGHDYLPLEYPIPPHLSLNPDVSDPKVFVSFITSRLKPSLEEGEVSFF